MEQTDIGSFLQLKNI